VKEKDEYRISGGILGISALILSFRFENILGKGRTTFIVPVVVYYCIVLNNVLLILEEILH